MTDPVKKVCAAGVWTLVAENVTEGFIRLLSHSTEYLYTQRDTGEDPPPAGDFSEGAIFEGLSMPISAAAAIDVYIWAKQAGLVRYDAQ